MRTPQSLCVAALAAVLLVVTVAVNAADPAAIQRGKTKFELTCAPCHGAGPGNDGRPALPGTAALQLKYKGALPALLEARTDLTFDVLKVYLRHGSWSMPPFRKTELTDAEIQDIAAYLATSPLQNGRDHQIR
jgi:mono/diheme cytochrome c family protein